jgi:alanine-synthesizing transaminase
MKRLEMISDTYLSMSAPVQHALPALLETRHGLREQLQKRVRDNLHELDRQLAQQQVCSRLDVEGGWYAILRVPVTRNDEELAIALMDEAKVIVQPGHFFDFRKEGFLVVSLITPEQQFAEGIRRVISLLGSSV